MSGLFSNVSLLLKRIGIILLLYMLCRVLFFLLNRDLFTEVGTGEFLWLMLAGLRFDLSAVIAVNALFIFLSLLPLEARERKGYRTFLKWLFFITNGIALAFNTVDMAYYRFTLKRSTFDLFNFIGAGDDTKRLLPTFLKEYWYLILVFAAMLWMMAWLYKRTARPANTSSYSALERGKHFVVMILMSGLFLIGFRGGLQLIPITIVSAAQYSSSKNIPIILNTPFSIIKSADQDQLKDPSWFSEEELKELIDPYHPADTGTFKKMNVMVIMMESFSKEYIGSLSGKKTCTPFLDSLIGRSLVFDNGYANGKKSIEGIPAIIAGIPALMNEAFITSPYGTNDFNSLASLLKKKGYNSTFYHGATNGSMSFDDFCGAAGFDKYYGRSDYNDESAYDGSWGIWDEEFFLRVADKMNEQPQPFLSALFTLTSHHPFPVPDKYKTKFPDDGILPIHKSISYTDHSLKLFFDKASRMPWFKNTLFVLTADHTGPAAEAFYDNRVGMYQVPIIFYAPGDTLLRGRDHQVMQHIDIMPTIMHYLNYDKPYFSFGSPCVLVNDKVRPNLAFNYINNIYAVTSNGIHYQFDGEKGIGLYEFSRDSLLRHDMTGDSVLSLRNALEKRLKAMIQLYNSSLIHNKMTVR